MRTQKINKNTPQRRPVSVIDDRTPKVPPQPDLSVINKPVRTVNYVEVRDMDAKQIQYMIQELNATYDSAKGGIHYFVPVRHGKIGTDTVFEAEWLDTVRKVCEVNENGEIVLKNGATDVHVIRQSL